MATSSKYFKALSILCYALIIGLVNFIIVVLFLILSGIFAAPLFQSRFVFLTIAVFFVAAGFFAGNLLFNKTVFTAKGK
jgi:hypothetical protein